MYIIILFSFLVPGCDNVALVSNGFCNDETNNPDCNYDSGDCCGYDINSEHCTECTCFHQETCIAASCWSQLLAGVTHAFVDDGVCNDETNNAACNYDGGDCCLNPELASNSVCNDDTNNAECSYDGGDCSFNLDLLGNGICKE